MSFSGDLYNLFQVNFGNSLTFIYRMYNNLIIYYFSGTGNALSAARWISEAASLKGINVTLFAIDRFRKSSFPLPGDKTADGKPPDGKTLTGFLYPTHGFCLPWIMLKFMLLFPRVKNCGAFILNTRAGMKAGRFFTPGLSGIAQLLAIPILLLKGFKIKGLLPLDMPSNWISVHPGLNKKTVDLIVDRCRRITGNFSEKILNEKRVYKGLFTLPIDLAIAPLAAGYSLVARFLFAKSFIASRDCNDCRLCEDKCPTEAIKIKDGRPYWSFKCESCMRCMNICPGKSIQTAHLYVTIVFLLLAIIPYTLWIAALLSEYVFKQPGAFFDLFYNIAAWGFKILFFFISYHILHFIIKNKSVNNLFIYTSLTRYWRRYRAPEVKASDFRQNK